MHKGKEVKGTKTLADIQGISGGAAMIVWLVEQWFGTGVTTGRYIVAYSYFASVTTAIFCSKVAGCYFTWLMKTASTFFQKTHSQTVHITEHG
jgi:hypothetical protein